MWLYTGAGPRVMPLRCYVQAGVVTFLVVMAFFALTPKPSIADAAYTTSLNKFIEIGLLLAACTLVTVLLIIGGCRLRQRSPAALTILIFVLWAMTSCLWSPDPWLSLAKAAELAMVLYVSLGLTLYIRHNAVDTTEAMANTLCWTLIVAVVVLFAANYVVFGTPFHFSPPGWGRPPRLQVGYAHPLDLVDLAALTGLVACATRLRAVISLAVTGLMFLVIHYADGRSGLGFLVVAMTILWYKKTTSPTYRFAIAVAGIGGFAFVMALMILGPGYLLPDNFSTLQGRIPLWHYMMGIVREYPLTGVGYYAGRYVLTDAFSWAGHSHNSYLEVLLTTGAVGFMLLVLYLAHLFFLTFSERRILLSGAVVYVALESMFNPIIFFPALPCFVVFTAHLAAAEGMSRIPQLGLYRYAYRRSPYVNASVAETSDARA